MATQLMTERQKNENWRARASAEYKPHELDMIDRFWTSLTKKIMKGSRISDARQGSTKGPRK